MMGAKQNWTEAVTTFFAANFKELKIAERLDDPKARKTEPYKRVAATEFVHSFFLLWYC